MHVHVGPHFVQSSFDVNRSRPQERFRATWITVCVKKTRQNGKLEPGFDSINTGTALSHRTLARLRIKEGVAALLALIRRDIATAMRTGGGALIGVLFFLTVVTLMPFAIGPDLPLLKRIGPAILWLGAMLASLLTLDRLFTADQDDGSLDLLTMGRIPLELVCLAKAIAHWLSSNLPLVVAAPVFGLLLNLDPNESLMTTLTLLAGTPALTLTGMIGAALAVTLRRGGLLLAVLVLPLSIPILIFGVAAANAATLEPSSFATPFSILCALSLIALVIGPFAAAASLRQGLD